MEGDITVDSSLEEVRDYIQGTSRLLDENEKNIPWHFFRWLQKHKEIQRRIDLSQYVLDEQTRKGFV